jgi:hypothetical protein
MMYLLLTITPFLASGWPWDDEWDKADTMATVILICILCFASQWNSLEKRVEKLENKNEPDDETHYP